MRLARPLVLVGFLFCGACGVGAEKSAIDAALEKPALRAQTFEATMRALDQHPDWVDELYRVARRHPPTMNRFVANDTRDLREKDLARTTAADLAENPASLERIFIETIDASHGHPEARAAIARAVAARHEALSAIVTDFPPALRETMNASVDDAAKKQPAREALLQSMRERSPEIASLIVNDPPTLKALVTAMAKASGGDAKAFLKTLEALLR